MVKTLERALDEIASLPEETQETIGQELLAYVAKLRALRTDLQQGRDSIAAGRVNDVDIEDLIARAHRRYGDE